MPALDGVRILDMTQYEAGTSCTQALAWLGADVVKVEPPSGDPGRGFSGGDGGDAPYFINWNSNKRSIAIDLATPEGRDLLLSMAPHYDAFVENYGPGRMEKLGIDYEVLRGVNPRIIYGRVKGFGLSGPWKDYKCFDPIAQAAAGAFSVAGEPDGPPMWPGTTTADAGTGLTMALSILAAYIQVQRTGEGQMIEVSMQEAMTYFMRTRVAGSGDWGRAVVGRWSNTARPTMGLYPCAPGGANDWITLIAVTSKHWDALVTTIDRPELLTDPRFSNPVDRMANASTEVYDMIAEWTRERTKWQAMEALSAAGVPCSAVLDTVELHNNPHLRERGFIHTLEHPHHGEIQLLGWAPRMSKSDVPLQRAPLLSEHADEVLEADLGLDEAQVQALREAGVVG